ncbi:MAG: hypothetical protein IJH09_03170, partial [Clostridia bacterium]|nr:hypothetical protein [Clostridia bacterium]
MRQHSSDRARIRRLRAQYRRRMAIIAILFLIIGIVLGMLVDRRFFNQSDSAEPRVVEVMVTPSATPYEEEIGIGSFGDDLDLGEDAALTGDDFQGDEDFESTDADFQDGVEEIQPEQADVQPKQADVQPEVTDEQPEQAEVQPEQAEQQDAEAAQPDGEDLTIAMETPVPEPTATPEPTPEPTPDPTPEPTTAVVPFGESIEFSTQIKQDGTARIAASDDPFETINFTMSLKDYMLPSDFSEKWGTVYKLQGTEAGAGFE